MKKIIFTIDVAFRACVLIIGFICLWILTSVIVGIPIIMIIASTLNYFGVDIESTVLNYSLIIIGFIAACGLIYDLSSEETTIKDCIINSKKVVTIKNILLIIFLIAKNILNGVIIVLGFIVLWAFISLFCGTLVAAFPVVFMNLIGVKLSLMFFICMSVVSGLIITIYYILGIGSHC